MRASLFPTLTALGLTGALSLSLSAAALFPWSSQEETEPAAVAAFSKNGPLTGEIHFSSDDFQVSGDAQLRSIVVDTLPDPSAGTLTIGGQTVPAGSEITLSAVNGLSFTPLTDPELSATSFTFSPVFSDGAVGEAVTVGLFLLSGNNAAPVAADLILSTYQNVELTGTFAAVDPEGDLLTYQLISKPARGTVTLAQDGSAGFVYTPYENKTGKDSFTYAAIDAVGNVSSPAVVNIKIEKQKTKTTYADMVGVEGHREAVHLAEAGLLVGEQMGDQSFFHPQEVMSRAQFTALALAAMGTEPLDGVSSTGFADDQETAAWIKPYLSSALRTGIVQGSYDETGAVVFAPEEAITTAEAAVILDRALNITDVSSGDTAPTWASQAVANLSSCGALPASAVLQEPLTRAQAAMMLSGALDVMESRESKGLFSW